MKNIKAGSVNKLLMALHIIAFIIKELPPEERKFVGAYTRKQIIRMLEKEQHGLSGNQN